MTEPRTTDDPAQSRKPGPWSYAAAVVVLVAIAVITVTWFWMGREPVQNAGVGLPHGIIVISSGALVAAIVASLRSMSVLDLLEIMLEVVLGVFTAIFAVIGAIVKGIWNAICSIFNW